MSVRAILAIAVGVIILLAGFGAARWWYGNRLIDAQRERNNLLAQADTLRRAAGGWEKLALTASTRAQLAEAASDELRDHLDEQGRRLRALTTAVVRIEDSRAVDTVAEARGDSTRIRWQHSDSTVSLAVALHFPGLIRPDPEPPVTGTVDVGVTIRPEIAISCDPDRGPPATNITMHDERITVLDLVTTVDEGVACLEPERPDLFGSLLPEPSIGTGIAFSAGIVIGFVVAR